MPAASVTWASTNVGKIESVPLGPGAHFVQEDYPTQIGRAINNWLDRH